MSYIVEIKTGDVCVSLMLYADDISLIALDADSPQKMLDCLRNLCRKWRLELNRDRTSIVHFRNHTMDHCSGDEIIDYADRYKYPGLWLPEHLYMTFSVGELTKSVGRALSALFTHFFLLAG